MGKRKNSIVKLKIVMEKLQKNLLLGRKSESDFFDSDEFEEVPADVKEGHFAVLAVDHGQPKRFIVPIHFLKHPSFLRLLEQAAEEYGFDHDRPLTVPCRPCELESILVEQWQEERDPTLGFHYGSCETMVKSCSMGNNMIS